MTETAFERYREVVYDVNTGPTVETLEDSTSLERANCQLIVHRVLRELGIELPPKMLSRELFEDKSISQDIPFVKTSAGIYVFEKSPTIGTVAFLGRENLTDARRLHLAIFTGEAWEEEPVLFHGNVIDKKASYWKLSQFRQYPRYEALFAAKVFSPL